VTEHRPPLSSPGRLALDGLGAAQLEVLLLISVVTADRYLQCHGKLRYSLWELFGIAKNQINLYANNEKFNAMLSCIAYRNDWF
jgi:hypothetical protein